MEREGAHTLFLACTRPAMFGGVPLEAMAINVMVTSITQTMAGLQYALIGVVIHVVCLAVVRHDHGAFGVLSAWLQTTGRCQNARAWGGFSLAPLPLVRTKNEQREINHG